MIADPKISNAPITLSQMVALSYTYRIMFKVLVTGPLVLILLQLVFMTSFLILDTITNQHTIITVIATVAFTPAIQRQIVKAAPTEDQAAATAKKLRYWFPALVLLACVVLARYVVTPLEDVLRLKTVLTLSPTIIPFATAFRLAIGSFVLGFSICARYVGPPSIVRCSSSPLAMHPAASTIRSITTSADAFLNHLTASTANNPLSGATGKPETTTLPPRRLQWPTFRAAFAQIIITIACSVAAAFTSVLPFTHDGTHGDTLMKSAIIMVAVVTNFADLFQSTLDGAGHEINPLLYGAKSGWKAKIWSIPDSYLRSLWAPGLLIVVASISGSSDWKDFCTCLGTAVLMAAHARLLDAIMKISLCSIPQDIMNSVAVCASDGSEAIFLDVVLQSLCHSQIELARSLINVSSNAIWFDVEKEEKKRIENAISVMAKALLYKSPLDESGPHLEEDILRLALVSSIGSWSGEGSAADEWRTLKEPYFVPICRGLCAYFGGLGEALIQCTSDKTSLKDQWLMSPGSVVLAEYSVRGATRCLLSAISSNTTTWRNSHLATLVPALLTSLFRLETGMLRYAQKLGGLPLSPVRESEKIGLFRTQCPQHLPLFFMVNTCSRSLLQKISQENRRSEMFSSHDREMLQWCDAKLDSIENPGGS